MANSPGVNVLDKDSSEPRRRIPTVEFERELLVLNLRSLEVTFGGSYAA